jgi:TRAP transporter TAXI family solute receptor
MRRGLRGVVALIAAAAVAVGVGGCSAPSDEWSTSSTVIAGGSTTGVYYDYGEHLAGELSTRLGTPVTVAETNGSVDNLLRIASGRAVVGFAQGDAAADAVAGTGVFQEPLAVKAVARLYDEYLHVVVRADSRIDDVRDLAGMRISLGAENSGVHVIAMRLLEAAGVDATTISDPQLGLAESIDAMQSSDIDGFFWVGGLPTPGIAQLAENTPVRLLPVEQAWVNSVNASHSGAYRPADIPAGTYGIEEPTLTMAVPNFLMTATDTPDAVVEDIVSTLFDARSRIAQEVPVAARLDRRQAIFTEPVELHPGALTYYRETRN